MIKVASALVVLAQPTLAANGDFLYRMCGDADISQLGAGYCLGAVSTIFQIMENGNTVNGMTACFPPNLRTIDAINIVVNYLEENPSGKINLRELSVSSSVATIFWLEFNCK